MPKFAKRYVLGVGLPDIDSDGHAELFKRYWDKPARIRLPVIFQRYKGVCPKYRLVLERVEADTD